MKLERWPWTTLCTVAGTGIGLFDFAVILWLGADMNVGGRDVTGPLLGSFVVSYALLGFAVGRVVVARFRARADAETIEGQLRDLERTQHVLVEQQQALAQHEKLAAIGRLAAGVAHEVRNPMGVIRASASMVKESFDPGEDPHRACEFICEEIDRLDSLIDGLLSFARPTQLELGTTSLEKVVDKALQLASDELRSRSIALEREGADAGGAPLELQADPNLLAQVVYGLVINAAQAVERDGRIRIRVTTSGSATDEAAELRVDVADDGPGIDPSVGDEIFEPFVTTKATGTGLGLAMATRIVEAHRGVLTTVPGGGLGADGAGACLRIRLPLGVGVDAAAPGDEPPTLQRPVP